MQRSGKVVPKKRVEQPPPKEEEISVRPKTPLIFVSHDNQDAELAEAFSTLVSSASAGILKIFRSSDTKGTQGIEYGAEWYPTLMKKLESASDIVCLLTERSIDRPWLLYEAGVAKGKLNTPVYGVALGIPLNRANTGPFAQFQNCDDNEESLTKLVMQLVGRIPDAAPNHGVVLTLVKTFKESAKKCLEKLDKKGGKEIQKSEEVSVPKRFEEIKVMFQDLPSRIEQTVMERPLRSRRFHPIMLMEMEHYFERERGNPASLLVLSSLFRDRVPWLYEMGMETYRAMRSCDERKAEAALRDFQRMAELTMHGPFLEELDISGKDNMLIREFLDRFMRSVKSYPKRLKPPAERG